MRNFILFYWFNSSIDINHSASLFSLSTWGLPPGQQTNNHFIDVQLTVFKLYFVSQVSMVFQSTSSLINLNYNRATSTESGVLREACSPTMVDDVSQWKEWKRESVQLTPMNTMKRWWEVALVFIIVILSSHDAACYNIQTLSYNNIIIIWIFLVYQNHHQVFLWKAIVQFIQRLDFCCLQSI